MTSGCPAYAAAGIAALRPGDRVRLRRFVPAGANGPGTPERLFIVEMTIQLLARTDDIDGQPRWYLVGTDCPSEDRGGWAVGRERNGMTTTLELLGPTESEVSS